MINSTDLKYFIETARIKHVSHAAKRLGISQPALTHCIQRIENDVGLPLFIRTKKGVILTAAGLRLFEESERLLQQWEKVVKSVHDEVDQVGGLIRVGCHSAVAQYTLPPFLPKLLNQYPRIKIQLTHGLSRHMTESVVSSKLDVAIVVNPLHHPDLVIKELCKDIVTLWKTKNCLNKKVLIVEPDLLQTQYLLKKLNRSFEQTLESSSLEVISQLLQAGTGYAILPKRVVDSFSIQGLIQVDEAPVFHDKICLIYKPEFKKTKTGQTFISCITNVFT